MTTSFELSKKLWDLGLKIETEKWWVKHRKDNDSAWQLMRKPDEKGNEIFDYANFEDISAPSTDELLAVMPDITIGRLYKEPDYGEGKEWNSEGAHWTGGFKIKNWNVNYRQHKIPYGINFDDKLLPEALGLMIKWLLENGWRWDETTKLLVKGGLNV